MSPVVERHARLIHEPEERLVDERGRLEGVSRTLAAEISLRLPAQLRIDERHERVERAPVPPAPLEQQARHLSRRCSRHVP